MSFNISKVQVTLIDYMGSDARVVDAARVSFNKLSENYSNDQNEKLIYYLAKNNHWSPFAHCFSTFRIKAPIFVARQLQKHTVGLSWNEVSRRYVDSEPEFYCPDNLRARAESVKQGSAETASELKNEGTEYPHREFVIQASLDLYKGLLEDGVAPEEARMYLPQNMMTEWIWSGSLAAFSRVCKLRLDPHTQKETQEVAEKISGQMSNLFPVSWKELQA